jgi:hypothetical protein
MSPRRSPDESQDAVAEQVAPSVWSIGVVTALVGLTLLQRRCRAR